jgi:protein-L-isoaspartate(D-aspartate) O-methyltransferase
LKRKGIFEIKVLESINKVPRHLFMKDLEDFAYVDKAYPIAAGQTISQPYTVAFQTQLLDVKNGDRVLEVGTGSGYQTAILIELGAKVFTIERIKELYIATQQFLPTLGYNPQFFYGDGYEGKPTYGPFDKILITAGAPSIPEKLLKQLCVGGVLVAPIGQDNQQIMTYVKKLDENNFEKREYGNFSFVPMLKGIK